MRLHQESTKSCRHTARKIPSADPGSESPGLFVEPFSCFCLPRCFRIWLFGSRYNGRTVVELAGSREVSLAPLLNQDRGRQRDPRRAQENHKGLRDSMEVTFALERAGDFAGHSQPVWKWLGRTTVWDPPLPDDERDLAGPPRSECERCCGDRHPLLHFQLASEAMLPQAVQKHWSSPNARH